MWLGHVLGTRSSWIEISKFGALEHVDLVVGFDVSSSDLSFYQERGGGGAAALACKCSVEASLNPNVNSVNLHCPYLQRVTAHPCSMHSKLQLPSSINYTVVLFHFLLQVPLQPISPT